MTHKSCISLNTVFASCMQKCFVTNATPTVEINSTKYTRNDTAITNDGDTVETPAVERYKETCV